MKIKLIAFAVAILNLASVELASAFNADAKTQLSLADTTLSNRLFSFIGQTNLAPDDSVVWFVADRNNNGLLTNGQTTGTLADILGVDDFVLAVTNISGQAQSGTRAGRLQWSGITVADNVGNENASIYVILFNQIVPAGSGPLTSLDQESDIADGYKFGVLNLGLRTPPGFPGPISGNANWAITDFIFADQYTFSAVPEPTTLALGAMGAIGAFVLYRRRRS